MHFFIITYGEGNFNWCHFVLDRMLFKQSHHLEACSFILRVMTFTYELF